MVVVSFFFSGCTSMMKDTSLINKPNTKKAIVNFVRPSIFFADGLDVDIWNGRTYLGSLSAGSMIQTEVEPGKYLFIGNIENFSYVSANLTAGKQYFIKANMFPGFWKARVALGVAKSDDERVYEWLDELTPTVAIEEKRKELEIKRKEFIQQSILDFEEGRISKFATMHPEDGHVILSEKENR
jgi:hypothetical protein